MIKLIIKETVLVKNLPRHIKNAVVEELTLDNPDYISRLKRGGYIGPEIPRYIYLYDELGDMLYAPRGYMNTLLSKIGTEEYEIIDRTVAPPITNDFNFTSVLRDYQELATSDVLAKRYGLLEAGTGAGKTAMAIYVASIRKVKTLILVHNKELLNQWHDALRNHTDIKNIGTISGDKFDIQDVTVGIINSASNKIEQIMGTFGLLVCDEGHRIVSTSWVTVINGLNCKYQLTLSATPYRRDGLTEAIFMLAGPKVHVVNKRYLEKTGAILVPDVIRCNTGFRYDYADDYTYMMTALCKDEQRNRMVVERIREEFVKYGEQIMVVSDRVSHCGVLCEMLDGVSGMRPAVLSSKMTRDARKAVVAGMRDGRYNIILSTAALLGEGFDLNTLSALFIATPISFKGKLTQIVGRILRPTKSDHKPRVYDVRDVLIAVLANSGFRRDSEYKKLGWIS
jgi:superfamily II DNA or RNA helicase